MARLWRDRPEQRADVPAKTRAAWADALGALIPRYSPAPLHALPSFPACVHAVDTVQKALYG